MKQGIDYIGIGVGALIVNEKKEVLLLHRPATAKVEPNCWRKPGGSVEFGETREKALRREILEEIGCEMTSVRELRVYDHILPDEKQHWLSIDYVATIKGTPTNLEPHKCDELRWFSIDDLPEHCSKNMIIDCVAAYKKFIDS